MNPSQVAQQLSPEVVAKLSQWHALTTEVLKLLNDDDAAVAYTVVGRVLAQLSPPSKSDRPLRNRNAAANRVLRALSAAGRPLRIAEIALRRVALLHDVVKRSLFKLEGLGLVYRTKRNKQVFWAPRKESESKAMGALSQGRGTLSQIAKRMGSSPEAAMRALEILERRRLAYRTKRNKQVFWDAL